MTSREAIERVRALSDGELLAGLSGALGASRRAVAVVLAHLAEVEERRLHLLAGYSSLFVYCTLRLRMSEDEAYRRIRVARLARRFPAVLERLARGELSLSVAALLEAQLTEANQTELLAAVTHKTLGQAREVLATWFPKPDVLPFIRKLPQRATAPTSGATASGGSDTPTTCDSTRCIEAPISGLANDDASNAPRSSGAIAAPHPPPAHGVPAHDERPEVPGPTAKVASSTARANRASSSVEPLAPGRYKVVFTASDDLKRKLDLARDLSRHAVPNADLASIIDRALDLLIEKTLQRRFARTSRPRTKPPQAPRRETTPIDSSEPGTEVPPQTAEAVAAIADDDVFACATKANTAEPDRPSDAPSPPIQAVATPTPDDAASAPLTPRRSRHLPSTTRRAVLERDGLRCTWLGPDGTRCDSQAWLEHDHITPRGQGGSDAPGNIRLRCRAHNRLAAEQAYGQQTITRAIAQRRANRPPH